jgi:hypothetical protein
VAEAAGDTNGDGTADATALYAPADTSLLLVSELGGGAGTSAVVIDGEAVTPGGGRIAAVADIEGDGDDDVWLVIGSGAATEIHTLVVAQGCDLRRPKSGDLTNSFPVGASLAGTAGIECVDIDGNGALDGFEEHSGLAGDQPGTYDGTTTHWVVTAGELSVLQTQPFHSGGEDPRFSQFTCDQ